MRNVHGPPPPPPPSAAAAAAATPDGIIHIIDDGCVDFSASRVAFVAFVVVVVVVVVEHVAFAFVVDSGTRTIVDAWSTNEDTRARSTRQVGGGGGGGL
jgi:hypothetical protein